MKFKYLRERETKAMEKKLVDIIKGHLCRICCLYLKLVLKNTKKFAILTSPDDLALLNPTLSLMFLGQYCAISQYLNFPLG